MHQIRWLAFLEAIDAVVRTMDSLLTYFSTVEKDPKALGMKKKLGSEMFIRMAYGMLDVLTPVMKLSLLLQKKDLDIGLVQVNLIQQF